MNKTVVQALKRDPRIVAAYRFGSYGTSKQTPLSDIDICLFTKDADKQTVIDLSSFASEKLDISIFDTLPVYIKPEVFKGTPLFVKDRYFVARKFAVAFREYQDFKRYQKSYWGALKRAMEKRKREKIKRL